MKPICDVLGCDKYSTHFYPICKNPDRTFWLSYVCDDHFKTHTVFHKMCKIKEISFEEYLTDLVIQS